MQDDLVGRDRHGDPFGDLDECLVIPPAPDMRRRGRVEVGSESIDVGDLGKVLADRRREILAGEGSE